MRIRSARPTAALHQRVPSPPRIYSARMTATPPSHTVVALLPPPPLIPSLYLTWTPDAPRLCLSHHHYHIHPRISLALCRCCLPIVRHISCHQTSIAYRLSSICCTGAYTLVACGPRGPRTCGARMRAWERSKEVEERGDRHPAFSFSQTSNLRRSPGRSLSAAVSRVLHMFRLRSRRARIVLVSVAYVVPLEVYEPVCVILCSRPGVVVL